ncbi:MAG: integrase core domain-containing protein [Bdellovibrionota bacterium]
MAFGSHGYERHSHPLRSVQGQRSSERFMRTLRQEALDHFIFLNERHVYRVTKEFVEFYNRARPHQGTSEIPNPPELWIKSPPDGRLVARPVLGGLQHDYRLVA